MKKHMAWPNASPHACGAYESASCCSNASPNACGSEMLRSADQTRAQTRPRPPNACPDASQTARRVPTRVPAARITKECLPLPGRVPGRVSQPPNACPHACARKRMGFLAEKPSLAEIKGGGCVWTRVRRIWERKYTVGGWRTQILCED